MSPIARPHHRAQIADAVDQPARQRHAAGQHLAAEQALVGRVDLAGAAPAHVLLEAVVDVLLQRREPRDIGRVLRQKRVEQRFALAGGMQPPLDAEALDQPVRRRSSRVTTPIEPSSEASSP